MRKTKIICTMGPSTDKGDVMEQLVREGMDVARFNFSHGPHDEQRGRIQKLRELRKKYDRPVAALLDTKGPEIRLGCFKDGKVSLEEGQIFTFTNKDIEGTNECVSITYKELYKDVQPGGHILVDDGLVDLEVQDIAAQRPATPPPITITFFAFSAGAMPSASCPRNGFTRQHTGFPAYMFATQP